MLTFQQANTENLKKYGHELFSILWNNMNPMDPLPMDPETVFSNWLPSHLKMLEKEEHEMILFFDAEEKPAGYFSYILKNDIFFLNDIQTQPDCQGKGWVYRPLMKFLLPQLPAHLRFTEAYVGKYNPRSSAILERFGMKAIGETPNGRSWIYRGEFSALLDWVNQK